jgi:hypothetical protein
VTTDDPNVAVGLFESATTDGQTLALGLYDTVRRQPIGPLVDLDFTFWELFPTGGHAVMVTGHSEWPGSLLVTFDLGTGQ